MKLSSTLKYAHRARISGHGRRFPLDMLRYDSCYPHTPRDVAILDAVTGDICDVPATWEVTVVRYTETKFPHWTVDRWASFNVTCFPLEEN
jgi:hypothetical protein